MVGDRLVKKAIRDRTNVSVNGTSGIPTRNYDDRRGRR